MPKWRRLVEKAMAASYQKSWLVKAVIRAADLIKASLKAGQLIFCEASACRQKRFRIVHTSDSMQPGHDVALRCAINHRMWMYGCDPCLAASWYPGPWEELTPKMLPTNEVHWAIQLGPDRWLITDWPQYVKRT